MKKLILIPILIFGLFIGARGQDDFQSRVNISLFAGGAVQTSNANNWGRYEGFYVDGAPIVSFDEQWRFGLFATANWSKYEGYSSYYENKRFEYAGGLNFGWYKEYLSPKFNFFAGQNLGVKSGSECDAQLLSAGIYHGSQQDLFIIGNTNLNLLKAYNDHYFPRMQLLFSWQAMTGATKQAFWNEAPIPNAVSWNKSYLELVFKQTFFSLGDKVRFDLKMIGGYDHYAKGDPEGYIFGGEASLHRLGHDDILSVYLEYKANSRFDQNFVAGGISFNFMEMLKKN